MKFTANIAVQDITDSYDEKMEPVNTNNKYRTMEGTHHNFNSNNQQPANTIAISSQTNPNNLSSNLHSNEGKLPEYLEYLLQGSGVCGDSGAAFQKPEWYDEEKFNCGQQFAINNTFGVMFAHMLSLIIVFAFQSGLEPLIYTGKSDTPYKAFKRYLSTVLRVKSWSETDIWQDGTVGNFNLKTVRGMHANIRKVITAEPKEEAAKKVTCEGKQRWTALHEEISKDFQSSCPVLKHPLEGPKHVYVNQTDMAVTQFAFTGLILLYPKMFGMHGATREDLDGYAHFWRTIGYLLGIEDRFNLCAGDIDTVKQRCQDMVDFWVKPCLNKASRDWIHMSRCMTEGISYYVKAGTEFEVVMLYLCHVLSIDAPRLKASLNFRQKVMFHVTNFIYSYMIRIPGMRTLLNWHINMAIKKGQQMPPERSNNLQQRIYSYERLAEEYN